MKIRFSMNAALRILVLAGAFHFAVNAHAQLPTNHIAPASVSLTLNTNGALLTPTNFFHVNAAALNAEIIGGGGSGSLTDSVLPNFSGTTKQLEVESTNGTVIPGTISGTLNDHTVTLAGGTWPSNCLGSILVVSNTAEQYYIVKRVDGAHVFVWEPLAHNYSNTNFTYFAPPIIERDSSPRQTGFLAGGSASVGIGGRLDGMLNEAYLFFLNGTNTCAAGEVSNSIYGPSLAFSAPFFTGGSVGGDLALISMNAPAYSFYVLPNGAINSQHGLTNDNGPLALWGTVSAPSTLQTRTNNPGISNVVTWQDATNETMLAPKAIGPLYVATNLSLAPFTVITGIPAVSPYVTNSTQIYFPQAVNNFSNFIVLTASTNGLDDYKFTITYTMDVTNTTGIGIGMRSINSGSGGFNSELRYNPSANTLSLEDTFGHATNYTGVPLPPVAGTVITLSARLHGKTIYGALSWPGMTNSFRFQYADTYLDPSGQSFSLLPNIGLFCLWNCSTNKGHTLLSYNISSDENSHPDVLYIGDSKLKGLGGQGVRAVDISPNSAYWGGAGSKTIDVVQTLPNLAAWIFPKRAVINLGRNDVLVGGSVFSNNYPTIVTALTNKNIPVFHLLPLPEGFPPSLTSQGLLTSWLWLNYGNIMDASEGWLQSDLGPDTLHPSPDGQLKVSRAMQPYLGQAIQPLGSPVGIADGLSFANGLAVHSSGFDSSGGLFVPTQPTQLGTNTSAKIPLTVFAGNGGKPFIAWFTNQTTGASAYVDTNGAMTATTFYGDGSHLTGITGGGGGGSQTPWAQNIDGGGFSLTNAGPMIISPGDSTTGLTVSNFTLSGSASNSALELHGKWLTTGSPTLIKAYVTNSNSGASSLLMDLGTGTTSQFSVDPFGVVTAKGALTSQTLNATATGSAIAGTSISTSGNPRWLNITGTANSAAGSATFRGLGVALTYNLTGAQTGKAYDMYVNSTETALNGLTHYLGAWGTGGTDQILFDNAGGITATTFYGDGSHLTGITGGGGGSQTPWAQNINGATFALTNAGINALGVTNNGALLTTNGPAIVIPADSTTALTLSNFINSGSAANPALDIRGRWNTTGTPTLISGYVTNSASGGTPLLLDLGTTSTSRFKVDTGGNFTAGGIGSAASLNIVGTGSAIAANSTSTSGNPEWLKISGSATSGAGSAIFRPLWIGPTLNFSGAQTGKYYDLYVNSTETALSGISHYLGAWGTAGNDVVTIDNVGTVTAPKFKGDFSAATNSILVKSANYTLGANDSVVIGNTASITLTLPTAVGVPGRIYRLSAELSSGSITVNTTSSQTVYTTSAVTSVTLNNGDHLAVISDNANWHTFF